MIVQSIKKDAIRKRKTTHVHGTLGIYLKNATAQIDGADENDEKTFWVKFHEKDLPTLKRIVARLEKVKGFAPLLLVLAMASSCSTANWRTIDQIQGNYTSWGPAPGKQVTTEQARADLERCTAWANTKPGSRTAFQHRCMIENGYRIVQVND